MYYTIYKITNNINGKYYLGMHKTSNLDDGYMGSGKLIKRAIAKYGVESFVKEILHIFDNENDMRNKEKELVIVSENTYNLNEGGKGGFGYINSEKLNNSKRSSETYDKIKKSLSNTRKEKMKIPEELEHMRNIYRIGVKSVMEKYPEGTWKGRKHKSETKKIIGEKNSILQKGKNNSQYGTCWITNGENIKKIKKEEFDFWSKKGYYRGRK